MSARYPIPAGVHRAHEEIERSRFITTIAPAATVEEAEAFIRARKAEFPDANHNCWAYVVGPPGSTTHVGMSDDGEPHGSPRNSWPARLTSVEQQGHAVRLATSGPPDVFVDVTPQAVAELGLTVGSPVWLSVKATDLLVYEC